MKFNRGQLRRIIFEMMYPGGLSSDHPDYAKFLKDRRKGGGISQQNIDKLSQLDLDAPDMSNVLAQNLGSYEPDLKPLRGPMTDHFESGYTPEDLGFSAYQSYSGSFNKFSWMIGYNRGADDAAFNLSEKSVDYLTDRYDEEYAIGYGFGYHDLS